MQLALLEVDVVPLQADQLEGAKPMAVGDQDHRGVAVAVPIVAGNLAHPLDLGLGQVFARANLGIALARRRNCPIFSERR
jgi:hypothetical protein